MVHETLKANAFGLSLQQDRAMYAVWHLSYEKIQTENPLAAHLLQLYAYFDSSDIWFELIRACSEYHGPAWTHELSDERAFNRAMGTLRAYGFVELQDTTSWQTGSNTYRIHYCLHEWVTQTLEPKADRYLGTLALKCIGTSITTQNNFDAWLHQQRLLPHAVKAHATFEAGDEDIDWVLYRFGVLYANHDRQQEAETIFVRVLQSYDKALGPDHTETLEVANTLGVLYANQGRVQEAEGMYNRALQGYAMAWGPTHTETLRIAYNLGLLYTNRGLLRRAQDVFERTLQGYEEAIGHCGGTKSSIMCATWDFRPLLDGQINPAEALQYCQRAHSHIQMLIGSATDEFESCKNTLLDLDQSRSGKRVRSYQFPFHQIRC